MEDKRIPIEHTNYYTLSKTLDYLYNNYIENKEEAYEAFKPYSSDKAHSTFTNTSNIITNIGSDLFINNEVPVNKLEDAIIKLLFELASLRAKGLANKTS